MLAQVWLHVTLPGRGIRLASLCRADLCSVCLLTAACSGYKPDHGALLEHVPLALCCFCLLFWQDPCAGWLDTFVCSGQNCLVPLLGSVRGYGFWYRFLTHPEGPSFTRDVCPKFSPMGDFKDNVAHSNMFYGLRCGGGVFVWHASALPEVPSLPASLCCSTWLPAPLPLCFNQPTTSKLCCAFFDPYRYLF